MLADALGDKLIEEADRGRARRAARRTTPSAESPSDSSAPSARARSADAFVGSWRGTWRFQQHSQSNDWPDDMPRQVTFTLTIARAGQGYTARGLEFDVEQVSVAGDTITIRGQSPYTLQIRGRGAKDYHGHHPETVRLTLKEGGRVLEGTWRTDSDPKRSDKWWQIGAVRATKL